MEGRLQVEHHHLCGNKYNTDKPYTQRMPAIRKNIPNIKKAGERIPGSYNYLICLFNVVESTRHCRIFPISLQVLYCSLFVDGLFHAECFVAVQIKVVA